MVAFHHFPQVIGHEFSQALKVALVEPQPVRQLRGRKIKDRARGDGELVILSPVE